MRFKDYLLLTEVLDELGDSELTEGIWDKVKAKLSGKKSKEELEDELARLKKEAGENLENLEKIKKTRASRDFHARRTQKKLSDRNAIRRVGQVQQTMATKSTSAYRAGENKAAELEWVGEDTLTEGIQDFDVTFVVKNSGGKERKTVVKGRDAFDVKRKFADTHYGAKIILIKPSKKPVRPQVETSDDSADLAS